MFIIDAIKNLLPIPTGGNKTQVAQNPKLVRDRALAGLRRFCQAANTNLPTQKLIQKLKTGWVCQSFEGQRHALSVLLAKLVLLGIGVLVMLVLVYILISHFYHLSGISYEQLFIYSYYMNKKTIVNKFCKWMS